MIDELVTLSKELANCLNSGPAGVFGSDGPREIGNDEAEQIANRIEDIIGRDVLDIEREYSCAMDIAASNFWHYAQYSPNSWAIRQIDILANHTAGDGRNTSTKESVRKGFHELLIGEMLGRIILQKLARPDQNILSPSEQFEKYPSLSRENRRYADQVVTNHLPITIRPTLGTPVQRQTGGPIVPIFVEGFEVGRYEFFDLSKHPSAFPLYSPRVSISTLWPLKNGFPGGSRSILFNANTWNLRIVDPGYILTTS